jgi:hypothetical protein
MESGFGQNLEGFLIKGNLSLVPGAIPVLQGDGSIEGSGTLYINKIQEYDVDNGIVVQDIVIKDSSVYVPYNGNSVNTTTASFILEGGLSIKNTTQAQSVTSGGGLTVAGGVSVGKNLQVGGILDVNGNKIINVPWPINGSDAVNKDYVDQVINFTAGSGTLIGNFTSGQVIIGGASSGDVIGYNTFVFDGNRLYLSSTGNATNQTTASFVLDGGVSIGKDLIVGGVIKSNGINVNNNNISLVASPLHPFDAANKLYVDSKTYGNLFGNFGPNEVIISTTTSGQLTSFPSFVYDGITLSIKSTADGGVLSAPNCFVCFGGVSIYKNLYVNGQIDVNGNNIINVAEPVNNSDAATKKYVDERTVNGNFTKGQLIVAQTNGTAIEGFNNMTFEIDNATRGTLTLDQSTQLKINNTTNAIGLGTGGTLTSLGGASFDKSVYIGGGLDVNVKRITNVDDPIQDLDAVNKLYVDRAIANLVNSFSTIILNNNVLIFQDIPEIVYSQDVRAFVLNLYVESSDSRCAYYTIYGVLMGLSWNIWSSYIGDNLGVGFSCRTSSGTCILQYTNRNTSGVYTLRYAKTLQINDSSSSLQSNTIINGNSSSITDIPILSFANNSVVACRIVIHVSSITTNQQGLYILNCELKGNTWTLHYFTLGNVTGIEFGIRSDTLSGVITYTNTNNASDYILRILQTPLHKSNSLFTLTASTFQPIDINPSFFAFQVKIKAISLQIHVEVPDLNKYALFEIQAVVCHNVWKLNSRYIGDNTQVHFSIVTQAGVGYLQIHE